MKQPFTILPHGTRPPQRGIAGKSSYSKAKMGKTEGEGAFICWLIFTAYSPKAVNPFTERVRLC